LQVTCWPRLISFVPVPKPTPFAGHMLTKTYSFCACFNAKTVCRSHADQAFLPLCLCQFQHHLQVTCWPSLISFIPIPQSRAICRAHADQALFIYVQLAASCNLSTAVCQKPEGPPLEWRGWGHMEWSWAKCQCILVLARQQRLCALWFKACIWASQTRSKAPIILQ